MNRIGDRQVQERVLIAHGGGGEMMGQLLREHLLPPIQNEILNAMSDGAVLPWPAGSVVFTTDSYVVTPLEFPGGDIGKLAVAGTINDLAVMGAKPIALSLGLILEEGLPLDVLRRVANSIGTIAREAGVQVVTGDTKVIERRSGSANGTASGMFINTAGVGRLLPNVQIGLRRVQPGDLIVINGPVAEHGLSVMSVRSGIEFETELRSDVAPLHGLIDSVLSSGADVKFMRDATRGGIAGVLADIAEGCGQGVEIEEACVPLTPTARHAAEMLGLDPLTVANEGKCLFVVAPSHLQSLLDACRRHPLGRSAAVMGRVLDMTPPLVELITRSGGRRIVQRPYGEDLPRIC